MRLITSVSVLALTVCAVASAAGLKFTAPDAWVSRTPASSMRVAEWTLPRAAGDADDALVTVYFFGATMGGNAQANIDRWIGQMTQPDGRASSAVAKTSTTTTDGGLKVTSVDVTGTYVAEVTPGSSERFNNPGWRQIAALVETPGGPYFVKVVGPAATVAKWDATVAAFMRGLRYE